MKAVFSLVVFASGVLVSFAQVSVSCAYGTLEHLPVEVFSYSDGATLDVDPQNDEVVFETTIVETQGGGGGFPENQLLAQLTIVFQEAGRFFVEREFFPFSWPSCLPMTARLNGVSISWLAMKNDGIVVEDGDELVVTLELSPSSCSGSFQATLSYFRLEIDCVHGCTYSTALNFNPSATVDDGSCATVACESTADINSDGVVNTADLIELLSHFGAVVPG